MHKLLEAKEEGALVERARQNPAAFRDLYDHYFPRVYGYIAARTGRAQDAEDLTADVFVKVVERLPAFEYRGHGSFTAWIFRIAQNRVAQFHRRQQRRPGQVPLDDVPDLCSDDPSPDHALMQKERFTQLQVAIGTLSRRRQEVITLKFFGGLRNQEIAAVLNLDERTVASHLCRALDDLGRQHALDDDRSEGVASHEPSQQSE